MVHPHKILSAVRVEDWDDVRWLATKLPGWLYRGQREESWQLETSLERACRDIVPGHTLAEVERQLVIDFQRAAHNYLAKVPDEDDWSGWLALMQHHGGPTRLLDFTRSIYVASFFALDDSAEGNPAIWAVNGGMIRAFLENQLKGPEDKPVRVPNSVIGGKILNDLCEGRMEIRSGYAATTVQPFFLDQRISIQQGLVFCGLNMEHSFEANLFGMFDQTPEEMHTHIRFGHFVNVRDDRTLDVLRRSPVVKMILNKRMRGRAMSDLLRMNISHRTLFPGLDGFTRSLKHTAYMYTLGANAESAAAQARQAASSAPAP